MGKIHILFFFKLNNIKSDPTPQSPNIVGDIISVTSRAPQFPPAHLSDTSKILRDMQKKTFGECSLVLQSLTDTFSKPTWSTEVQSCLCGAQIRRLCLGHRNLCNLETPDLGSNFPKYKIQPFFFPESCTISKRLREVQDSDPQKKLRSYCLSSSQIIYLLSPSQTSFSSDTLLFLLPYQDYQVKLLNYFRLFEKEENVSLQLINLELP